MVGGGCGGWGGREGKWGVKLSGTAIPLMAKFGTFSH